MCCVLWSSQQHNIQVIGGGGGGGGGREGNINVGFTHTDTQTHRHTHTHKLAYCYNLRRSATCCIWANEPNWQNASGRPQEAFPPPNAAEMRAALR